MAYTPINWNERPASDALATPLSARNLNHMDLGIKRTHAQDLSESQRNQLTGADLFTGRMVYNRNLERLQVYTATRPVSPAPFNTPGWFSIPTYHDVVQAGSVAQTVQGVKTFAQPIVGRLRFIGAKAFLPNTRAITANTFVRLAWDGEDYDTNNMFNPIADPHRIFIPFAGYYQVNCHFRWNNGSAGPFDVHIRDNQGVARQVHVLSPDSSTFEATQSVETILLLQVGQFVEVFVKSRRLNSEIIGGAPNTSFTVSLLGAG